MGSQSEPFEEELEKIRSREIHAERSSLPAQGTKRKANSDDFTAVGGQFSQARDKDKYPPQIDLTEEEQMARSSQPQYSRSTSFPPSLPGGLQSPVAGSSERSHSSPHLHNSGPYIQPSDFSLIRDRKHARTGHMRDTHSSEQSSDPTSAGRRTSTATHIDDDGEDDGRYNRGTTPTQNATSTTPSRRSVVSTDDEETRTDRGPSSPNPFSTYYRYNPQPGQSAVHSIETSGSVEQRLAEIPRPSTAGNDSKASE